MRHTQRKLCKKLLGIYSVLNAVNYLYQNLVSLAPTPKLSLSSVIKSRRFRLILVSFFKGSAYLHSGVQMSSAYRE